MKYLSQSQLDELYVERVLEARRMPLEQRLELGGVLFDDMCERMRDGIRADSPHWSDAEVEAELDRRLRLAERLEEGA